jgi:hypothetical protein
MIKNGKLLAQVLLWWDPIIEKMTLRNMRATKEKSMNSAELRMEGFLVCMKILIDKKYICSAFIR